MLSKKDFILVAEAIRTARRYEEKQNAYMPNPLVATATSRAFTAITYELIKAFKKINPRFDKEKFLKSIYH